MASSNRDQNLNIQNEETPRKRGFFGQVAHGTKTGLKYGLALDVMGKTGSVLKEVGTGSVRRTRRNWKLYKALMGHKKDVFVPTATDEKNKFRQAVAYRHLNKQMIEIMIKTSEKRFNNYMYVSTAFLCMAIFALAGVKFPVPFTEMVFSIDSLATFVATALASAYMGLRALETAINNYMLRHRSAIPGDTGIARIKNFLRSGDAWPKAS